MGNYGRVWWKEEEDMIKFILEEVIWTEVVYILEVMFVEVVLALLQHLCLSLYLCHICVHIHTCVLALCPAPEAPGPRPLPRLLGSLKLYRVCIPGAFPKPLPTSGHFGSLQAGLGMLAPGWYLWTSRG